MLIFRFKMVNIFSIGFVFMNVKPHRNASPYHTFKLSFMVISFMWLLPKTFTTERIEWNAKCCFLNGFDINILALVFQPNVKLIFNLLSVIYSLYHQRTLNLLNIWYLETLTWHMLTATFMSKPLSFFLFFHYTFLSFSPNSFKWILWNSLLTRNKKCL